MSRGSQQNKETQCSTIGEILAPPVWLNLGVVMVWYWLKLLVSIAKYQNHIEDPTQEEDNEVINRNIDLPNPKLSSPCNQRREGE